MITKKTRSEARKEYWATVPKEKRREMARKAALAKHSKTTYEEKRALAMKMVEARRKRKI